VIIQVIISICILALFLSILVDFMFYSENNDVQKEKKSVVETGTMTLFFLAFYFILKSNMGIIPVPSDSLKCLMIVLGTISIVAGCIMNIQGRLNLGRNWSNHIKIYNGHTLVQKGMYKIVRHPLYFSIILMFYGACLVYHNLLGFFAVTLIFVPFMYYRAKQEENLLIQTFPEYAEYKLKTGMLFPKIIK